MLKKNIFFIFLVFLRSFSCAKQVYAQEPIFEGLLPIYGNQIIYQIMVDRFYSEKIGHGEYESNDLGTYQGGNLEGIIQKLDYIQNLGATAILLNPVTDAGYFNGYSVLDLFKINPHFGTNNDYRRLVDEVHRRGMKILFDFVAHHQNSQSEMFKIHPDWFRQPLSSKAINDPDIPEVWSKVAFFFDRNLKLEDKNVYEYLLKAAKFWIDYGVDGFRMDAGSLIPPEFFKQFTADIKKYAGINFLVMSELYFNNVDHLNLYASFMDGSFDFDFFAITNNIIKNKIYAIYFKMVLNQDGLITNPRFIPFTFIDNHDMDRFVAMTPLDSRTKMLKLALTILFTVRGVPTILYGTEVALDNVPHFTAAEPYDHGRNRMIFDHNEENPVFQHIQRLSKIRKNFDFNSKDKDFILDGQRSSVVSFIVRNSNNQVRLIFYNFSNQQTTHTVNLNYVNGIKKNETLNNLLEENKDLKIQDGYAIISLNGFEASVYANSDVTKSD